MLCTLLKKATKGLSLHTNGLSLLLGSSALSTNARWPYTCASNSVGLAPQKKGLSSKRSACDVAVAAVVRSQWG